jgi:hypothetical protein
VSIDEISTAVKSINTGKAESLFGMSIENILFANNDFSIILRLMIVTFVLIHRAQ